jgi:hypothetical protein
MPSLDSSAAQQHGGNLDPFEAAVRPLFVKLDQRLAFQVAGDHPGQRLGDDQPDGLVVMPLE